MMRKIKEYKFYYISYFIGLVCMFLMLSYSQVLPTGKYNIMIGDSFSIYVPTIKEFIRDILSGNSIYYSWSNSFGNNTSFLNAFTVYNPFNLLFLLLSSFDSAFVLSVIVLLKSGLISLCFFTFLKNTLKISDIISLLFSLMYCMCSYNVDSNIINFMWMDALYILPILILVVERLINNKKNILLLSICFFYAYFTNFYTGYMISIFTLLYLIFRLFIYGKNKKTLVYFFASSFFGALLSSFVWLPVVFYLKNSGDSSFAFRDFSMNINFFEVLSQFFMLKNSGPNLPLPEIYVGILTIILLPLFFVSKDIERKNKFFALTLLILLFVSFFIPHINLLWHGFDVPDGWSHRFSFLVSFCACSISAFYINKIKKMNYFWVAICSVLLVANLIVGTFFQFKQFQRESFGSIVLIVGINVLFIIIWNFSLSFYNKYFDKTNYLICFILIAALELIVNGVFAYTLDDNKLLKDDFINTWKHSSDYFKDYYMMNQGFYRIRSYTDLNANSGMWYGYNSMDYFSSSENSKVRKFVESLGGYTSERVVENYSDNPVLDLLFGVKYYLYNVNPYSYEGEKIDPDIKENPYYVSVGYLVDESCLNCELNNQNAFENINKLSSILCPEVGDIYVDVDKNDINIDEEGISLLSDDNYYYLIDESDDGNGYIFFEINKGLDEDYYFYMDNITESTIVNGSMLYLGGYENDIYNEGYTSVSYIKMFESENDCKYIGIESNAIKKQAFNDFYIAKLDFDQFNKLHNEMLKYAFEILEYRDGYIKGRIVSNNPSNILLLSIPYDKNWKVYVDDEAAEYEGVFDEALIGIRIKNPGEHVIELKYKPKGVFLGIFISVVSWFSYFWCLLYNKFFIKN